MENIRVFYLVDFQFTMRVRTCQIPAELPKMRTSSKAQITIGQMPEFVYGVNTPLRTIGATPEKHTRRRLKNYVMTHCSTGTKAGMIARGK
jgi:hypothetical protein